MNYNLDSLKTPLIILVVWELIWKSAALWKSAQKNQKLWFASILIFNTLGILPVIYLLLNNQRIKDYLATKNLKTKIIIGTVLSIAGLFILSVISIGISVGSTCSAAKSSYKLSTSEPKELDCVDALSSRIFNVNLSAKDQRSIIWALGQFGDKRALPTLNLIKNGGYCKEPIDQCEYELDKAIKWTSGSGTNILSPIWQRLLME